MDYDTTNWQFRLLGTVFHGPKFGHYMEMERQIKGRDGTTRTGLGQWTGVGIPEDVFRSASGLLVAAWEEHLITRYGCRDELPMRWAGEGEPF